MLELVRGVLADIHRRLQSATFDALVNNAKLIHTRFEDISNLLPKDLFEMVQKVAYFEFH
jgi:hypothetical protein